MSDIPFFGIHHRLSILAEQAYSTMTQIEEIVYSHSYTPTIKL